MASRFHKVSISVSPLEVAERAISKFRMSADKRFAASSKVERVRVLFSKNRFTTVLPRNRGTFLIDRKSTRLNSSHVRISYAVFCLKKKKKKKSHNQKTHTT